MEASCQALMRAPPNISAAATAKESAADSNVATAAVSLTGRLARNSETARCTARRPGSPNHLAKSPAGVPMLTFSFGTCGPKERKL